MKMQNDKLLPCPFCGGEAAVHTVEAHSHVIAKFMPDCKGESFIECTKCTCAMSGDSEEGVINAWNTRKPMERIVEQLEERRKLHNELSKSEKFTDEEKLIQTRLDGCFVKALQIVKGGVDNAK